MSIQLYEVDYTRESKFKYILIQKQDSTLIVAGWSKAEYHADILDMFISETQIFDDTVLGGGRIHFNPTNKKILVYGHSLGFPWPHGEPENFIAAEIIQPHFPGFSVEFSNEGY